MSSFDAMIGAIGGQQGKVTELMDGLQNCEDPGQMLEKSMQLMQEQQKLTIMSEGFTKTMKAHHDAQKSAITNMH
jgi:hypothetical protein